MARQCSTMWYMNAFSWAIFKFSFWLIYLAFRMLTFEKFSFLNAKESLVKTIENLEVRWRAALWTWGHPAEPGLVSRSSSRSYKS